MEKYIFKSDANFKTFSFKKGDIVEGTIVPNNQTSEPPSFLEINKPTGLIRIGLGGRAQKQDIVERYAGKEEPHTIKSNDTQTNSSITQQKTPPENKKFFTPKNIIIGLLAIGTVLGLLKWQKVI